MADKFDDVDLKSPFASAQPPPSYFEAIQQNHTEPIQYTPQDSPRPQPQESSTYPGGNPIGFGVTPQTYPQDHRETNNYNYGQAYPPGTAGYPGPGMYSQPASPPTTYVVQRTDCPQANCARDRLQRRRRVIFAASVFGAVFAISLIFWIIF